MNKDGRAVGGMTLGGTLTVIFVVALIWAVHKFK